MITPESRKDFKRLPGFDPISFTFIENSNCERESLLEVWRQNIAGHCQQTFENKKFVSLFTTASNVLPLHLKQTFPFIIWVFVEVEGDVSKSRIPFKIFPTLWINTCIENTWYSHVQIFYYKSFKKHLKICIRWFPSSIY